MVLEASGGKPVKMRCCKATPIVGQSLPDTGPLARRLDWSLNDVVAQLEQSPDTLYTYIIRTVKEVDGQFVQQGSGPNFSGGYVTLCTCKHRMRTFRDCESWTHVWVAGLTGSTTGRKRNDLVYLMKVGWAFPSHRDLWYSKVIPKETKAVKAAHKYPLGDLFRPIGRNSDPYDPRAYRPPVAGHSHGARQAWFDDICYFSSSEKPAALLVGDPKYTFIWHAPQLYSRRRLSRGQQKWTLPQFVSQLSV